MLSKSIAVLVVAFVIAWAVTKVLIPLLKKRGVLDVPNARSSHVVPTPRGGGIGIIAGLIAGLVTASLLGMQLPGSELLVGAALVALIGFADDHSGGLSIRLRLALQLAAAGVVVFHAGGIARVPLPEPLNVPLGPLAIPLALIWIVAVTNLYNFLDGMDGFAGLQGAVAGLGVAFLGQDNLFFTIGFAVTGACAGFLLHNWHPAKVFMGDTGSGTLGFLLAALPFQLQMSGRGGAVFVVAMCLWFFLADGVFTILSRLFRGEKIWEPHRSHLYQRLVKAGLPHDRAAVRIIGAATVLAALAIISFRMGKATAQWSVLATSMGGFFAYYCWTWKRERVLNRQLVDASVGSAQLSASENGPRIGGAIARLADRRFRIQESE